MGEGDDAGEAERRRLKAAAYTEEAEWWMWKLKADLKQGEVCGWTRWRLKANLREGEDSLD